MADKPKLSDISWDWKDHPSQEELQSALKPFGVFVTDDPRLEGSDSVGYIFSDRKLTREELKRIKEDGF